jgi:hypothetical protein
MAKEATLEAKEELVNLISSKKTELTLSNGKTVNIGYITGFTQDIIDNLIVKYEKYKKSINKDSEEDMSRGNTYTRKFYAKCAAAIILNSYFGNKLFWWLKWRLIYYFGGYNGEDYLKIITEAKKSNGAGVLVGYGISDGYDNDMDNDDEERSRSIPSRTGIGKRGSIIEKFPGLGQPLVLFGGLITIPYWGYLTTPIALMDVMIADLPHIQYNPKDNMTKQQEDDLMLLTKKEQEKIKKGGLAELGLNLEFKEATGADLFKK